MRKMLIGILVGVLFTSTAVVLAGNLNSPGAPTDTASESYSLEDIYNRLHDGTAGTQRAFTEPGSGPGSTGNTLNEIMAKAPAKDNNDGAGVADVAKDKKFWGLTNGAWGLHSGIGYTAAVSETGQTKCYDAGGTEVTCAATGQDGELQKGVVWPTPRFTNNNDGTVTDNLTGLIWLKNAGCAGTTRAWSDTHIDIDSMNTEGRMNGTYCGDRSNNGSGKTDWRLPNVREFLSLVDYGQSHPALPAPHPFTGVAFEYWSSTSYKSYAQSAWKINIGSSGDAEYVGKAGTKFVWPVRGGQ